jgi:hypothetical protein
MRPILLASYSVNHMAPSEPCVPESGMGMAHWVIVPAVVMRPMLLLRKSARAGRSWNIAYPWMPDGVRNGIKSTAIA